jgi:hypothetical protein
LTDHPSAKITGAAIGNESMVIGWYRDAACEPPDWNVQPIPAGQTVTLTVPGLATDWQVEFYATQTGTTVLSSISVPRTGGTLTITLPGFTDDIAFKMTALGGTVFTPVPATDTTDPVAGGWSGTIASQDGTFSTLLEVEIQAGCQPGQVCGTFSTPQLPCSGELFLQSINAETFVFKEQNITGAEFCASGGFEQLTLQTDGTLFYEYLVSPGLPAGTTGILGRQ